MLRPYDRKTEPNCARSKQNRQHDVRLCLKVNALQVDDRDSIKELVIPEKLVRGRLRIIIMDLHVIIMIYIFIMVCIFKMLF